MLLKLIELLLEVLRQLQVIRLLNTIWMLTLLLSILVQQQVHYQVLYQMSRCCCKAGLDATDNTADDASDNAGAVTTKNELDIVPTILE